MNRFNKHHDLWMKVNIIHRGIPAFSLLFVVLSAVCCGDTYAQSRNVDAINWFRLGVEAKTTGGKIDAYQNAIQQDPNFTEALYNLGQTYKSIQDFRNAEIYFRQALIADSASQTKQLKLQIMYELAVTCAKNQKLNESEELLRDALALSKKSTLEGLFALELGKVLYRTGQYRNALTELNRVESINPNLQDDYKKLIRIVENRVEMQNRYREGRQHEINGEVAEAKAIYEALIREKPDYEDVKQRLAAIKAISEESVDAIDTLNSLYTLAIDYAANEEYGLAISLFEQIINENPNYKDTQSRLINTRRQANNFQKEKLLNSLYAEGITASNNQNWKEAVNAFDRAVKINSNYRDATIKLQQARNAMEQDSMNALITQYYKEGTTALNQQQYKLALAAFERIQRLDPGSRNIEALITSIRDKIEHQREIVKFTPTSAEALAVLVDSLHQAGISLIARDDWEGAVDVFEKLNVLVPDDPAIQSLLQKSRTQLIQTDNIDDYNHKSIMSQTAILYGAIMLAVLLAGISVVVYRKKTNRSDH